MGADNKHGLNEHRDNFIKVVVHSFIDLDTDMDESIVKCSK